MALAEGGERCDVAFSALKGRHPSVRPMDIFIVTFKNNGERMFQTGTLLAVH